jgi:hypothetical protein
MSALSDADRAFYLLLITVCLSICLVWALWNMDQKRERRERKRSDDQPREGRPHLPYERHEAGQRGPEPASSLSAAYSQLPTGPVPGLRERPRGLAARPSTTRKKPAGLSSQRVQRMSVLPNA